ncbi:MAG: MarR family transcriptional regulator [Chthoniobacteraceae bacterium]
MAASPNQCADELLETVPHLMRVIRTNVRSQSGPELSMPQFRTLAFLGRNQCAMLGDVAAFLGLTLPAASKLVDGLVAAKLASREIHAQDRRRVSLELTKSGQRKYAAVVDAARDFLAAKMRHLKADERATVVGAMQLLHDAFADAPHEEPS